MKQFSGLVVILAMSTCACAFGAGASSVNKPVSSVKKKEHAILYALSRAKPTSKQAIRLNLAAEYIAQQRNADAMDVLGVIGKNQLVQSDMSTFLFLRGAAEFGMRHYAQARRDLESPLLENDPKAAILRSQLHEVSGEHALGILALARAAEGFKSIPKELLSPAFISGARSQLALGRTIYAKKNLILANRFARSQKQHAQITLLQGQVAAFEGNMLKSARYYAVAQTQKDPFVSAQASYNLIVSDLVAKRISEKEATSLLQRLRLLWRGDQFELSVLEKTGDLYQTQGRAREALSTWRMVTRYFPASKDTRRIDAKQRELFKHQFFIEKLAQRKPIESLALFSDFRELTPLGADGDSLIRQLVDQMLDAGLKDRAAGLLDYQVRYRLTGAAQASVALQLAALQTQIGQSEKAIEILNSTKDIEVIPEIAANRRLVMARALTSRGDFSLALEMVRDVDGILPDEIRSDIYWRRKDWLELQNISNILALQTGSPKHILRLAYAQNMLGTNALSRKNFRRDVVLLKTNLQRYALTKLSSVQSLSPDDIKKLEPILVEMDVLALMDAFVRPAEVEPKNVSVPITTRIFATEAKPNFTTSSIKT